MLHSLSTAKRSLLTLGFLLSAAVSSAAEPLDGVWVPTSAELAGDKFPDAVLKTMQLTMSGNTYSTLVGENKDEGSLKIDFKSTPPAIDIIGGKGPNQGKLFPAIFELQGDTLRICYDLSGKKRPTQFATARSTQLFLVTYERKK